jgi:aconitate hydratase
MYRGNYSNVFDGNPTWNAIESTLSELYSWKDTSTYVQNPPYFEGFRAEQSPLSDLNGARVLAVLGDSITTDHISPAGAIPKDGPAGLFLLSQGVQVSDFNSFGSRRGNDRIMTRGTFANIRLKNQLVPGVEGGYTTHFPDGKRMSIYDAAMQYREEAVPLIILAGKEYGSGSSRDWAAKGPLLLGVRAVIAESFERIHRTNLVGMGILPLQFAPGENLTSLGLTGKEVFYIQGIDKNLGVGSLLPVRAVREDGSEINFNVVARVNTEIEVEYYRNGGIMQTVLLNMLNQAQSIS